MTDPAPIQLPPGEVMLSQLMPHIEPESIIHFKAAIANFNSVQAVAALQASQAEVARLQGMLGEATDVELHELLGDPET